MKPCFPIMKKKLSENCNVNAPQERKTSDMEQIGSQRLWCYYTIDSSSFTEIK